MYWINKIVSKSTIIVKEILSNEETGKTRYGKGICVRGNIPQVYKGMKIDLTLEEDEGNIKKITDYDIDIANGRNLLVFHENGVNALEYGEMIKKHKSLAQKGVSWEALCTDRDKIYASFPFGEADMAHKSLYDCAEATERLDALSREVIKHARQRRKIEYSIEEYLSMFSEVEKEGAYESLWDSIKMLCLERREYGYKGVKVFDTDLKEKEEAVNKSIRRRFNYKRTLVEIPKINEFRDSRTELDAGQREALSCLNDTVPCIITGGPGTGKTTMIKAVTDCYGTYYDVKNILLVAPTGRAARRLAEKTGLPTKTIHAAIRKNPEDDFVYYHERNPLPYKLVVVDESSMIGTELMYDLLNALDYGSKIIFVGDHNQLYPVDYGEPFFDFLKVLKTYTLTENHRQEEGSDILNTAKNILENKPIKCGRGVIIKRIKMENIKYFIRDEENFQIISPFNEFNGYINGFLKKGEDDFNVGDKVMTIRNTEDYCNGDIGRITSITPEGITVVIEDRQVVIPEKNFKDLVLAYAITVHKMQGSESGKVMVFLPSDRRTEKRMLYTAVTRAKKDLLIYYYEAQTDNETENGTGL